MRPVYPVETNRDIQEDAPLLSVAMGLRYRYADTALLERAVDSILAQSYRNIEFLICENGSTPEAKTLLRQYEAQDERLRLVDGEGASSLAAKLNRCIARAAGAYVARQDDDDYSHPQRLQTQMRFLLEHPRYAFVGCNVRLVCDGCEAGLRQLPQEPSAKDFLFTMPFIHPALVFRKSALTGAGAYCEEERCNGCEDYDLLLRMYGRGECGYNLQTPLFTYSLPPKGVRKTTWRGRRNEARTRYRLFRDLGWLPQALPYVLKPLLVELIPLRLLEKLKKYRNTDG